MPLPIAVDHRPGEADGRVIHLTMGEARHYRLTEDETRSLVDQLLLALAERTQLAEGVPFTEQAIEADERLTDRAYALEPF